MTMHTGRFKVRVDEDTGRRYWWGGEDGWKDPAEIGENGVLTIDAQHFAVGTVLHLSEPEPCFSCGKIIEGDRCEECYARGEAMLDELTEAAASFYWRVHA
jgi:hypothetical protein